jgi:hypothetical protein
VICKSGAESCSDHAQCCYTFLQDLAYKLEESNRRKESLAFGDKGSYSKYLHGGYYYYGNDKSLEGVETLSATLEKLQVGISYHTKHFSAISRVKNNLNVLIENIALNNVFLTIIKIKLSSINLDS